MTAFQKGDRVDWQHYRDGTVTRVGLGTLWVNFRTCHGTLSAAVPLHQAQLHVEQHSATIGMFRLTNAHDSNSIFIERNSEEGGLFDISKLERVLEKFWQKEF